jgi:hypothetical protein
MVALKRAFWFQPSKCDFTWSFSKVSYAAPLLLCSFVVWWLSSRWRRRQRQSRLGSNVVRPQSTFVWGLHGDVFGGLWRPMDFWVPFHLLTSGCRVFSDTSWWLFTDGLMDRNWWCESAVDAAYILIATYLRDHNSLLIGYCHVFWIRIESACKKKLRDHNLILVGCVARIRSESARKQKRNTAVHLCRRDSSNIDLPVSPN